MISTELLSEVLCVHVRDDWYFDCEILVYTYDKILGLDENYKAEINIYELAHKCKEWAFFNDFNIVIKMRIPDIYRGEKKIDYGVFVNDELLSWWFSTELEATFKACELILKEMR